MIGNDVHRAARLLREGGIVAIPTETVYGLAANAFDEAAVLKIFQAKQRPAFDPLIVHVCDRKQVEEVVSHFPPGAEALMEKFWPGPLTLVLPKKSVVPDIVTSGLDTVGVRMPAHPLTLELLRSLDFPLAAPSANPFGYVSPTNAQHVADQLGDIIPYILDGGACAVGVESTIIGYEDGRWVLYRPGGIPVEAIEALIGVPLLLDVRSSEVENGAGGEGALRSPGLFPSHYSPRTGVIVGDMQTLLRDNAPTRCAVISFTVDHHAAINMVLSPSGDLNEAARKLFAALRSLDASDVDLILAEVFPEEGLGRAINDRLRRASTRR